MKEKIIELLESQSKDDVLLGLRIAEETFGDEIINFLGKIKSTPNRLAEYRFKKPKENWENLDVYSNYNYWIGVNQIEVYNKSYPKSHISTLIEL